jgi:hypothetical protein
MTTVFLGLRLLGRTERTAELAKALGVKWDTAAHLRRRLAPALRHRGLVGQLRDAVMEAGHPGPPAGREAGSPRPT